MKNLIEMIKDVEEKQRRINALKKLVENYALKGELRASGKEGYNLVIFQGEQAQRLGLMLKAFIAEEELNLKPTADTLNTLSDLVGGKHD